MTAQARRGTRRQPSQKERQQQLVQLGIGHIEHPCGRAPEYTAHRRTTGEPEQPRRLWFGAEPIAAKREQPHASAPDERQTPTHRAREVDLTPSSPAHHQRNHDRGEGHRHQMLPECVNARASESCRLVRGSFDDVADVDTWSTQCLFGKIVSGIQPHRVESLHELLTGRQAQSPVAVSRSLSVAAVYFSGGSNSSTTAGSFTLDTSLLPFSTSPTASKRSAGIPQSFSSWSLTA